MYRVASSGGRITIVTSPVSSVARAWCTLPISCASWARLTSSQNTAGTPVARARVTARRTQSMIAMCLVCVARQISPFSTWCSMSTVPSESSTSTTPSDGISKVLSWLPYSSAA